MDKFLRSQTFKTGVFVLLVLFILLIVFKLGVFHGYKKATYPHIYGTNYSQIHAGTFFGKHGGSFNKDMHRKLFLKRELIRDKMMLESKTEEESGVEELNQ